MTMIDVIKMKRCLTVLLMILMVIGLAVHVKADFGPKPTTDVTIEGLDEPYDFDLLVYSPDDVELLDEETVQRQIRDYYSNDFPDALNGYQDEDGYVSYTLYTDQPHHISRNEDDPDKFHVGYFSPPDVFKIALVPTSGNKIIVSEVIEKTMFHASFTFDVSDMTFGSDPDHYHGNIPVYVNEESPAEKYPVVGSLIWVMIAVVFTVVVEGVVMLLFAYRTKESYKIMIYVNLATQTLLQVFVVLGFWFWSSFGAIGVLLLGELIVLILEIILYVRLLKEKTKLRAGFYAFAANMISFAGGLILLGIMSAIFG